MVFIKRNKLGGVRTHHVHLMPNRQDWSAQLSFRDYLREHSEDASLYTELKQQLAKSHEKDREKYTDAKASVVADIVKKATIDP